MRQRVRRRDGVRVRVDVWGEGEDSKRSDTDDIMRVVRMHVSQ